MGCHCREISIIESDLVVIRNAVSKLGNMVTSSGEISKNTFKYAENLNSNIDMTNKQNVVFTLKDLNKDEPKGISSCEKECTDYKIQLENRLEILKMEDTYYHEHDD
ncbi:hypothetical protein HBE96_09110 [Clostridium sp. P21]|uniref:Uncharacterized protein n=1 Tax=Clostridium muellerianum TaxID=2716538 RepID=A0A7Y0EGA7_9CLOT|nr:hypothetical protein [Clostridium muellerianum]NMM62856.1 hypothetical protein [Clostridium muellerianum]